MRVVICLRAQGLLEPLSGPPNAGGQSPGSSTMFRLYPLSAGLII